MGFNIWFYDVFFTIYWFNKNTLLDFKQIAKYIIYMAGIEVKVKNLKKNFGQREILRGVSFTCKPSESVIILGESGMGKSVMMKIIGMLMDATSGSVKIGNQEIVGITERNMEKTMKNIGFLFQYSGLFEHLSVWENIMFYQLYIEKQNKEDMKETALNMMSSLDIPETAMNLKPTEISGGMQRRVAFARTIVKQPKLILLDEPTTGLDPVVCENVNATINKTKAHTKATMITITHDLNSALKTGDKIVVLQHGRIVWEGKPYDIFDCDVEYVQKYIKAANIAK